MTVALTGLTPSAAAAQTRALKIYQLHTREKATIVFKRNGRYDQEGLKKLNYILRDWRRNEPIRMDPRLFDLLWEVYQKSGSNDYINVVCGYRAPETNSMLRSRSKGVAEKSQHVQGKAMDFFIPGVKLAKLREIGMKFQVGGVGYYPRSGSPFVHMDVGSVRSWPRMPRQELARLFPDGRTLHRPAEGGNMPGYNQAMADYRKRVGSKVIEVAGGGSSADDGNGKRHKSLLASLFGGDENEEAIVEADLATAKEAPVAKKKVVEQPVIVTASVDARDIVKAPVPIVRPAFKNNDEVQIVETALVSPARSAAEDAMDAAMATGEPENKPEFVDLAQYTIPLPVILGDRNPVGDAEPEILTASVDPLSARMAGNLTSVPVPDERPEIAAVDSEALAKVAALDILSGSVPEPTKEEIAALAAEASAGTSVMEDATTDEDEVDLADSLDLPAEDSPVMTEMASLEPAKKMATRSFDLSAPVDAAVLSPEDILKPHKGGRPKKADAQAQANAAKAIQAEPKLTRNIIAKWAMTTGRVVTFTKPVKAPRFVSSTMRAQPTTVYAAGFNQDTAEIDPARFSGTAVNFLTVKKFSLTN